MSPERWQQIKLILNDALECAPAERAALLNRACADDAELRSAVESLLAYQGQAQSFIESPAHEATPLDESIFATNVTPDPGFNDDPAYASTMADISGKQQLSSNRSQASKGQRIGPYRVLREVGHGGMGAVYLAARDDDQYQQQVAIKIIKRGMDSDFVLQRFRNERQILATLDHPNIARLLDGGTTEEGAPYLVMEYIEGKTLNAYCDSHKLTTVERLKLFRQVCAAVHYAHQRLIIHRDLKPSNILVTKEGVPKLLDFGIAKLLAPEMASQTLDPTAPDVRLMTPAYASPEQVKGEPITTASDVYSLGVILYELLTGRSPYRQTKNPQLHDMMQAICQEEPERPSTAITREVTLRTTDGSQQITLTAEAVSQTHDTQPDKLRRKLRGDIDNIVLMALRKEPQRRYASVEQFSEDLQRHLDGLPVIARKDTLGYRSAKFIKRNKWGVAAAAVILVTLVAGIVTTMQQRARAERRFNDVRKLAHTVLFEYQDAIADLSGSTPLRRRLVKDALDYLDSLAREAGRDAGLQRELASAYEKIGGIQGNSYRSNLGDTAGAMKSYRKSLEIREPLAARDPSNRELQSELAESYEGVGDMLYTVNDLKGGLQNYEKALEIRKSLVSAEPSNFESRRALAEIYARVGDIKGMEGYPNLGDTAGALESYRQSAKLREELFAAAPEKDEARYGLAKTLSSFGYIAGSMGDLQTAVESQRRSVSLLEQLVAAHPHNATYRTELASAYVALRVALVDSDLMTEAIENDRKTVRMMEAMATADPQNTFLRRSLGVSYNALGRDLKATGDVAGAMEHHRKALEISQALAAADPQSIENRNDVSFSWEHLAEAQAAAHDFRSALESYYQAAGIKEAMMKAGSSTARDRDDLSIIEAGLGVVMMETGDTAGALAALRQGVSLVEAAATQSPGNLKIKSRLAQRYFECGQIYSRLAQTKSTSEQKANWQAARDQYQHSLSMWRELSSQGKLSKADAGKPDEAARALDKCEAALAKLH